MSSWYPACGGSCSLNTDTLNESFRETRNDPLPPDHDIDSILDDETDLGFAEYEPMASGSLIMSNPGSRQATIGFKPTCQMSSSEPQASTEEPMTGDLMWFPSPSKESDSLVPSDLSQLPTTSAEEPQDLSPCMSAVEPMNIKPSLSHKQDYLVLEDLENGETDAKSESAQNPCPAVSSSDAVLTNGQCDREELSPDCIASTSNEVDGLPSHSYDWSQLPHHVLLLIFNSFSGQDLAACLSLICQRWASAAASPALWRHCPANLRLRSCSPSRLAFARQRLEDWNPREMSLYCGRDDLDRFLGQLMETEEPFLALQSLDLGFNSGPIGGLVESLAFSCPSLTALNLEGVKELDDVNLGKIADALPQLTHLCISHCLQVSDSGLERLARGIRCLRMLSIDGIDRIHDQGVESLVRLQGSNLERLYLDGGELSDTAFKAIARHCTQLSLLSVSFAEGLTNAVVPWLKQLRHSLRHLHLRKARDLSGEALADLFEQESGLRGLRFLSLGECSGLTDAGVEALSLSCPELESLCLSWCWSITDAGLGHIFGRLERLSKLCLEGCKLLECTGIALAPPSLAWLDARQCNSVRDDEVEALVKQRGGKLIASNYYGELVTVSALEDRRKAGSTSLAFVGEDREKFAAAFAQYGGKEGACCMTSY